MVIEKEFICNNCGEIFRDPEAETAAEAECPYCYAMDCYDPEDMEDAPDERLLF